MSDIASEAGVSRSAVSYVLNGRGEENNIGERTTKKILSIAKRLNFSPNRAAQQLAGKRSRLLAVLAGSFFDAPQHRAFAWMSHVSSSRGLVTVGAECDSDSFSFEEYVSDCLAWNVEGLLYLTFDKDILHTQAAEALARLPRVVSLFDDPGIPGGYCVEYDSIEATRRSVEYLHRKGRRKIVLILENLDTMLNRRRYEGFLAAHTELGIPLASDHLCFCPQNWDRNSYPDFAVMLDDLIDNRHADAILADSDFSAAFVIKAIHRRGLRTPEDVAVMGWGDEVVACMTNPAVTTVNFRMNEVVTKAIDLVTELIEHPDQERDKTIRIEPELIVRESA